MDKQEKVLDALKHIDPAGLERNDWAHVGMALKQLGFDLSVWDEWSKRDTRPGMYSSKTCMEQWNSFHGHATPLGARFIFQLAEQHGWRASDDGYAYEWNDKIRDDNYENENNYGIVDTTQLKTEPFVVPNDADWGPRRELKEYLGILFEPDEHVGYVVEAKEDADRHKFIPASKGDYTRTAGQLIADLERYEDICDTIGDYNHEAGAWIRFNPLDGDGIKDANVTAYRYALVESDDMPLAEQQTLIRALELPVACLVYSGGKSLHAIVKVNASSKDEYYKRVDYLHKICEKNGLTIDKQNKNPSRLSRMPGVTRDGNKQFLIAKNIGKSSWDEWYDWAEGINDGLPPIINMADVWDNLPPLAPPLIDNILRQGHKMLIAGPSKAGKSFLLMELCTAIAEGLKWLNWQCAKGKVLYVNLELDEASCQNRFDEVYTALGVPKDKRNKNLNIMNLRGMAVPMDKLAPKLIRKARNEHYIAIVIDPIYKVITGDENSADQMAYFCNQFDKICKELGCAVIYCHHHSKGAQGMKKSMDRASGSGVFARDPDALLDISPLQLTEELREGLDNPNVTAWRMETSLREFPDIHPVDFWFKHPIHVVDTTGELGKTSVEGTIMANLAKSKKYTTFEDREQQVNEAYDILSGYGEPVTVKGMAECMGVSMQCTRDRLSEMADSYSRFNGIVTRIGKDKNEEAKVAFVCNKQKQK